MRGQHWCLGLNSSEPPLLLGLNDDYLFLVSRLQTSWTAMLLLLTRSQNEKSSLWTHKASFSWCRSESRTSCNISMWWYILHILSICLIRRNTPNYYEIMSGYNTENNILSHTEFCFWIFFPFSARETKKALFRKINFFSSSSHYHWAQIHSYICNISIYWHIKRSFLQKWKKLRNK